MKIDVWTSSTAPDRWYVDAADREREGEPGGAPVLNLAECASETIAESIAAEIRHALRPRTSVIPHIDMIGDGDAA